MSKSSEEGAAKSAAQREWEEQLELKGHTLQDAYKKIGGMGKRHSHA
jgi:hypothetical protein